MSACTRQRTLPETHHSDTGTIPPKVVRCVLNADHVGYHVDEDGLPFGPWIETPARPPAERAPKMPETESADRRLSHLLEAELSDYMADEPDGWVRQAARQVVESVRLAGWMPTHAAPMPAEEEPEGIR